MSEYPSITRRDAIRGMGALMISPLLRSSALARSTGDATGGSASDDEAVTTHRGKWHGDQCRVGYHFDLHVRASDKNIGVHCDPKEIAVTLYRTEVVENLGVVYVRI